MGPIGIEVIKANTAWKVIKMLDVDTKDSVPVKTWIYSENLEFCDDNDDEIIVPQIKNIKRPLLFHVWILVVFIIVVMIVLLKKIVY